MQAAAAGKEGPHLYGNGQGQMRMGDGRQFLGHGVGPFTAPDFAPPGQKRLLQEKGAGPCSIRGDDQPVLAGAGGTCVIVAA
jgi:hypothetical protein